MRTLGMVSANYERTGGWDDYEIKQVHKPFVQLRNDDLRTWDAAIYACISEHAYAPNNVCYGPLRAAFFPLFPMLWKVTGSTPIGISVINWVLFIVSVSVLTLLLLKASHPDRPAIHALLIALPSTVVYHMPYTEAMFLFTMTIAALGIMKGRYWLFFIGAFLTAMTRPATVFVLIAFIGAELIVLLRDKQPRSFLRAVITRSLPFAIGYVCTLVVQHRSSGSWTAFLDAHQHWEGGLQPIQAFSDWSVEGFGLSSFAIFFVCLPALALLMWLFIRRGLMKPSGSTPPQPEEQRRDYLLLVSLSYLTGMFVFTLLTSGGNLHSFFRFTLASPLFYMAVLILLDRAAEIPARWLWGPFLLSVTLLVVFLGLTDFGGNRLAFPLTGLYLSIATTMLILAIGRVSRILGRTATAVLIVLNTVWNTYLLNAFLSNGWIFT